jgi:hypothetical protein
MINTRASTMAPASAVALVCGAGLAVLATRGCAATATLTGACRKVSFATGVWLFEDVGAQPSAPPVAAQRTNQPLQQLSALIISAPEGRDDSAIES